MKWIKLQQSLQGKSNLRGWAVYGFLLPAFLVVVWVALWPLIQVLFTGFTNKTLFQSQEVSFVGLANFVRLLKDPIFVRAVVNTVVFTASSVFLETVLGLIFATLMHYPTPYRTFLRTVILVPWAIPTIISTKMWEWMLADVGGVMNYLLQAAGIVDNPIMFVGTPLSAMLTVIVIDVWKTTPFMALILLGGMQLVSSDLVDVGRLDGISPWRFFFKVVLPQLRGTLVVAISLRVIDAMRVFDVIYGLVGDNPSTISMSCYIRQQMFAFQSLGISSAAATVLLLTVSVFIYILLSVRKKG